MPYGAVILSGGVLPLQEQRALLYLYQIVLHEEAPKLGC